MYSHMLNMPNTLLLYRGTLLHRLRPFSFLATVAFDVAVFMSFLNE